MTAITQCGIPFPVPKPIAHALVPSGTPMASPLIETEGKPSQRLLAIDQ